jgi:hypothetical protein
MRGPRLRIAAKLAAIVPIGHEGIREGTMSETAIIVLALAAFVVMMGALFIGFPRKRSHRPRWHQRRR